MTNAAAARGKKEDKRKRRWGTEKFAGRVKNRGDNWNNVTSSSKMAQVLLVYPLLHSANNSCTLSTRTEIFSCL